MTDARITEPAENQDKSRCPLPQTEIHHAGNPPIIPSGAIPIPTISIISAGDARIARDHRGIGKKLSAGIGRSKMKMVPDLNRKISSDEQRQARPIRSMKIIINTIARDRVKVNRYRIRFLVWSPIMNNVHTKKTNPKILRTRGHTNTPNQNRKHQYQNIRSAEPTSGAATRRRMSQIPSRRRWLGVVITRSMARVDECPNEHPPSRFSNSN